MNNYLTRLIKLLSVPNNELSYRYDLRDIYGMGIEEYTKEFLPYEVSLLKKLKRRDFHTADYPHTGSYDFHFGIDRIDIIEYGRYSSVYLEDTMTTVDDHGRVINGGYVVQIYVTVSPEGTVDLDGETVEINNELINDHEWGWEISMEIKDNIEYILEDSLPPLLKNSRFLDIVEIYPILPD